MKLTYVCTDTNVKTRVYLQTASIYVFNNLTKVGCKIRAVLDCGATASYVSQKLFDALSLFTLIYRTYLPPFFQDPLSTF
jgi:hypothetical protein